MSKLVIFGATGQQGRSILDTVYNDPKLSKQYSVRAITRDISQPAAREIVDQGIEVIQADVNDPESLPKALENGHTAILITNTVYDDKLKAREYKQVKAIGDASVAAGNGRAVDPFDSKAEGEEYLRSLPLKTAFFAPGPEGTYTISSAISPDTKIPLIDAAHDSGKYVAALLADPDTMAGVTLYAATRLYSFGEIVKIISKVSEKTVNYAQVPEEVYAGFMQPEQGHRVTAMMRFFEEIGYFGPNTNDLVNSTVMVVKAKLTTFEEFAEEYLVQLRGYLCVPTVTNPALDA
ncbi:NmrA-like domain-containing protein 1 [Aspergillus hancockii]|nr:NmrA-like domain-containing protein 1 [Aspergillus hancockii]